jgi:hypothetical protein
VEGVLGLVGFSLGASIGMSLVRAASGGVRPFAREVVRAGLAVGDAVSGLAGGARTTLGDLRAEVAAERDATARGREPAAPQRIVIARD